VTDAMTMRERLKAHVRTALAMRDAQYHIVPDKLLDAILDELANPTPAMVEAASDAFDELESGEYHAYLDLHRAAITAAVERAKEG
jgi:hemoglobin-like flavoprotein